MAKCEADQIVNPYRLYVCSIISRGLVKGRILFTRRKRLLVHVSNFGERSIQDLVGKHEGKVLLGKPRHRWEDNTKMGPKEVG